MYARGTVFEDLTMDIDGGHGEIVDPTGVKQAILDASAHDGDPVQFYNHRAMVAVPSWDGEGEVMTSMDFNLFRYWFQEAAVHVCEHRSLTLINATEGGARIEGFQHVPLADAIASHIRGRQGDDLAARLERVWEDAPRYSVETWQKGMQRALKDCQNLVERVTKALHEVDRTEARLREVGPEHVRFTKAVQRLSKAEKRVAKDSRDSTLVGACVQTQLTEIMGQHYDPPDGSVRERWQANLTHSRTVLETISQAALSLLDHLDA